MSPRKDYIFNLIEVVMTGSYFKEPSGIFRTDKGFSMGVVSLWSSEMDMYYVLIQVKVINEVKEHDRFRDNVKIHVSGWLDIILCALRIIIEGYAKVITLNVKTGLITGSFLTKPPEESGRTTWLEERSSWRLMTWTVRSDPLYIWTSVAGHLKTIICFLRLAPFS